MTKGFVYNLNKCVGCNACMVACSIENKTEFTVNYRKVNTYNKLQFPGLPLYHLSLACNHCDDAPCVSGCPSTALRKNEETGIVTINDKVCIGCKYCTWTCPYDAPKFNLNTKVVEKCNLCESTVINGGLPACALGCPTGALNYKEIHLNSTNSASFPKKNTQPRVEIIPSRKENSQQQIMSINPDDKLALKKELKNETANQFSIISEWSLISFTFLVTVLFGWFAALVLSLSFNIQAHLSSTQNLDFYLFDGHSKLFITISVLAGLVSFSHLGKQNRAINAFRNLKKSWLSREIFFYTGFFVLSFYYLMIDKQSLIGTLGLLSGFLMLFSIDKVYSFSPKKIVFGLHSAHVLISGMLFTALFLRSVELFSAFLLLKLFLYLIRKIHFLSSHKPIRLVFMLLRIFFGFFIPIIQLISGFAFFMEAMPILISILIGELIDRIEFYLELEVHSPQKQILDHLKEMTS